MSNDDISPKVRVLPNPDLQTDRLMERHYFHCPKCNRLSFTNFITDSKRKVYYADMVIHCEQCGDMLITSKVVKGKEILTVAETGEVYVPDAERKEAFRRMESADRTDLKAYVDICNRYADELKAETIVEELYVPYVRSMSAIRDDLKKNGPGNLEYACHQILRCCDIGKLELLDVLYDIYRMASDNEKLLPKPLYQRIMVEYYLLNYARNGMFCDDDFLYDAMVLCAEDHESLTPEERAQYPFTAFYAYRVAFLDRSRNGSDKEAKAMAKKMIASIDDALGLGAEFERKHIMDYFHACSFIRTKKTNPFKKPLKKVDLWKGSDLYKGIMSAAYAEYEFRNKLCDGDTGVVCDDQAVITDVLDRVGTAIDCLEKEIDMSGVGYWLVCSYVIRGILSDKKDDVILAVRYADYFMDISCMSARDSMMIYRYALDNFSSDPGVRRIVSKVSGFKV